MASEHRKTTTVLPIPDAHRLIVTGGHDPRALMVKVDGADVVEMADKSKDAATELVVPDFDLVVIATGHEERLRTMEVDTSDRAFMLVKAIDQGAHTVIPQLDSTIVETGQDPWAVRVEGQALDAVALRLELCQHDGGGGGGEFRRLTRTKHDLSQSFSSLRLSIISLSRYITALSFRWG